MKILLSLFFCLSLILPGFAKNADKPVAQSFSATTLDGREFNLEELRGKVVVLTFWSTRCVICNAEIPKYNQLADKYAGKDVVFLAMTMENEVMVGNYLKKKPFKFTIVPNSLGVIMQYADKNPNGSFNLAYPTMYIINKKGEIELKTSGRKSQTVDETVSRLLSIG